MKFTTTTVFFSLLAGALAAPLDPVDSEKRDMLAARAATAVPDVYTVKARHEADFSALAVDDADNDEEDDTTGLTTRDAAAADAAVPVAAADVAAKEGKGKKGKGKGKKGKGKGKGKKNNAA